MNRPYVVIRHINAQAATDHYEQLLTRRCVDTAYVRNLIDQARTQGTSTDIVSQHTTLEEAEKAAASRHAGPGVKHWAEYCDIGDLTNAY
ncbi:hypothetical protein ABT336_12045 [Micromonospora sp. NPDC000207]|uniref:hypothetical protein n=1 Tax=Micromonospora sp. NPDC000207 TaxID=3154246 RepID=UPI00333105FC